MVVVVVLFDLKENTSEGFNSTVMSPEGAKRHCSSLVTMAERSVWKKPQNEPLTLLKG